MAERSGFFNALHVGGEYDRKYNANDYSDSLAVIIGNGVLRSENDDLRVTASGMQVQVAAGRAWINGKYYNNDAPLSFAAVTAPAGGTRWDRIMLRLDNNVTARSIKLRYVQGTAANEPEKPAPVRADGVYELVLADIFVGTNANGVIVTDTRADVNLCGWVYSTSGDDAFFETLDNAFMAWFDDKKDTLASVTLFKRYNWRTQIATASRIVAFSIPQYNEETSFLEVYVNGILEAEGVDYTRAGSVLTFTNSLIAGTEVVVRAYKSIDGTGIESVGDEITQLQNSVAALTETQGYDYICNGYDDNVKLSQIAQAWLDGGTEYSCKKINVYGTFGAEAPVAGEGTAASPYRWIAVGSEANKNRRIIFDFSACTEISLPVTPGTNNAVFYGINAHIIGANVNVYEKGVGTVIRGFARTSGTVYAENCRFWLTGDNACVVANTGTFTNCRASVANSTGNSYCFLPFDGGLLRLNGGEYYAYTGATSAISAVVGQSAANAVSILNGVNAPTATRSGYYQTHSVSQFTGGGIINCTDLVTLLAIGVIAGSSEIRGTIARSKPGMG